MPRPGVDVSVVDVPTPVSVPSDTGTSFIVGLADRGPLTSTLVQTLQDFIDKFGNRTSYSSLYDAVELFFKEGGYQAYIARVVGPAAAVGTLNLLDGVAAVSLIANAAGPGAWSATNKVGVVAGGASGTFQIEVSDTNNVILEQSGDLATQSAAVLWSQYSNYIRLSLGSSLANPAVMALTALSAGTDDRNNITDTQWKNALDSFSKDLGPGQVWAPGRTTDVGHTQLGAHATLNNRVALLDLPDSPTEATLLSSAAAARGGDQRNMAAYGPWVVIPGIVTGTTRTVPPSALVAGLIARNDSPLGTNRPSAGRAGVSRAVIDLSQPAWNDISRNNLNNGSVNVIRRLFNGIEVYGWRSLVDATIDRNWVDFANARFIMKIKAEFVEVGENFMFEEIDGQNGRTITAWHTALAGVCLTHFNRGELFGETADEGFVVDTGVNVNTLATIADRQLKAVVQVKPSQFAEYIPIQIVKREVTEVLV